MSGLIIFYVYCKASLILNWKKIHHYKSHICPLLPHLSVTVSNLPLFFRQHSYEWWLELNLGDHLSVTHSAKWCVPGLASNVNQELCVYVYVCLCACVFVCGCVCLWERETERNRETKKEIRGEERADRDTLRKRINVIITLYPESFKNIN